MKDEKFIEKALSKCYLSTLQRELIASDDYK
jgi:hypothetical protein